MIWLSSQAAKWIFYDTQYSCHKFFTIIMPFFSISSVLSGVLQFQPQFWQKKPIRENPEPNNVRCLYSKPVFMIQNVHLSIPSGKSMLL